MNKLDCTIKEISTCRDILSEINNFGISELQRITLIHLMSLELEDVALMKEIAKLTKHKKLNASSENDEGNKKQNLIDI